MRKRQPTHFDLPLDEHRSIERFNRALADEWAYARLWRSEASRARGLDRFLHRYNYHRHHTAINGTPASRVTNLAGHNR